MYGCRFGQQSIWSSGWQIFAMMADAMNMDSTLTWMNSLLPVSIGRQLPMRRTILLEAPCLCCQGKQTFLCQTLTQKLVPTTGMPMLFLQPPLAITLVHLHQPFHTHTYICINIAPSNPCNLHIAVLWCFVLCKEGFTQYTNCMTWITLRFGN